MPRGVSDNKAITTSKVLADDCQRMKENKIVQYFGCSCISIITNIRFSQTLCFTVQPHGLFFAP